MVQMQTPIDRRRFMKHLGILGFAGVLGMSIGEIFSPTESDLIEAAADAEIANKRKLIWASRQDAEEGDLDKTLTQAKSGGFPYFNRRVCAYHLPDPETGEYEDITDDNQQEIHFCRGPCVEVCPVDAIKIRTSTVDVNRRLPGLIKKSAENDLERDWGYPQTESGCIGCQNCFKMCGYDAIQWVNP
jgi:NAD-dependent dihydropyrimidine dehydrogenase PreA subunit